MITTLPANAIEIAESIKGMPAWKGRAMVHKLQEASPEELPRAMARMAEIGPPYAKLVELLISEAQKDGSLPKGSPMNKQTSTVNTL